MRKNKENGKKNKSNNFTTMMYEHCDDAILLLAQVLVGVPGEPFEN